MGLDEFWSVVTRHSINHTCLLDDQLLSIMSDHVKICPRAGCMGANCCCEDALMQIKSLKHFVYWFEYKYSSLWNKGVLLWKVSEKADYANWYLGTASYIISVLVMLQHYLILKSIGKMLGTFYLHQYVFATAVRGGRKKKIHQIQNAGRPYYILFFKAKST